MRVGRPSSYSDKIGLDICRQIEEGATIREICAQDGYPNWETIRRWLRTNDDFRAHYAHAREASGEALELSIIDISKTAIDKDSAAAARVQIDALKWIAAKRSPKVYGDKIVQEHTGVVTNFVLYGERESEDAAQWQDQHSPK